ncbi:hypothetical protein ACQ4LE_007595, partial [Meloidogyne hapla]
MPTKTEFTFEPQTLGITPIIQQNQINNPRKRKLVSDLFETTINNKSIISPNNQLNNHSNELKKFVDNKKDEDNNQPTFAALEELLFSNVEQRKKLKKEESSSNSSTNNSNNSINTLDSKQQLKTLKEALRAASENRER